MKSFKSQGNTVLPDGTTIRWFPNPVKRTILFEVQEEAILCNGRLEIEKAYKKAISEWNAIHQPHVAENFHCRILRRTTSRLRGAR